MFTNIFIKYFIQSKPNFSTCLTDLDYNKYVCQQNYIKERLKSEAKCLWPFQVYNNLIRGKGTCVNMTDFAGERVVTIQRMSWLNLYPLF